MHALLRPAPRRWLNLSGVLLALLLSGTGGVSAATADFVRRDAWVKEHLEPPVTGVEAGTVPFAFEYDGRPVAERWAAGRRTDSRVEKP